MKTLAVCGLSLLLSSGLLLAQRRSGGAGTSIGTNSGYGNVVFPAGKPSPGTPFSLSNPNFGQVLGNVVAGRPPYSGIKGYQHRAVRSGGGVIYVPYAYPVFTGGYGGYYGGYGDVPQQQQQPNVTIIYPAQPPQQQTPVMMYPAPPAAPQEVPHSQIQEYGQTAIVPQAQTPVDAPQESNYYLLAFKDHSIYSAVGYWVDGETLHYITTGNVHNQVSVSLVDRELTEQLNKGRGTQVRLPAAPASR